MFGARKTFIALAGAAIVSAFATGAQAESPFHTGVWQVNTAEGPQGLVVSDWLIFDDGLPSRWIYRRSGANDQNQFDFYVRTMGQPIFVDGSVRVYRTGENAMKYTVFLRGQQPVENPSIRLSQPNYIKSCLSVENKGERLFGAWRGTKKSSFKRIRLSKNKLTIDGKSENVEIKPVRVGRLGILKDGQPIAFFTDAGGGLRRPAALQAGRDRGADDRSAPRNPRLCVRGDRPRSARHLRPADQIAAETLGEG